MIMDKNNSRVASHWKPFNQNRVECTLCPRHCRPKQDSIGFCGVRGNLNNQLHTFNFGKSLAATEEVIETEAINHFMPGSRILSLGNIGCMMACSFCQNWETSQVKHLDQRIVREYSPQSIVDICLQNNINVLSWTYNDPVVWQEFVVETSTLAQQRGIKTLYKSALYIESEPLAELIQCIDIFSISLKSMSEQFYKKITRGRLGPVLEGIKQIARSDRHLEISQLVIPELNDSDEDISKTIHWVLEQLGDGVPLHFVAFHPAYKYTHVNRTDVTVLQHAKALALQAGLKHIYLGNTHLEHENNTVCAKCAAVLVRRYGLHAETVQLDHTGCCSRCGAVSPIKLPTNNLTVAPILLPQQDLKNKLYIHWHNEMQSAHILQTHCLEQNDIIHIRSLGAQHSESRRLRAGLDRFIVSRHSRDESGLVLSWDSDNQYERLAVLDRAHFPVAAQPRSIDIPIKVVNA